MQATRTPQTEQITINDVKNICRYIKEFDDITSFEVKSIFRHFNNYYLHSTCQHERQAIEELKNCVEYRLSKG